MFRRVLILAALVLGCGVSVSAQGFRIGDAQPVSSSLTSTSPITPLQASVNVCVNPANAVPCTNKASTFTSVTLATPCSAATQVVLAGTTTCVTQTDVRGNWGAWVAAGNYDVTFTLSTGQSFGPYTISVGIPAGTTITGRVNMGVLSLAGPSPWIDVTNPAYAGGALGTWNGTTGADDTTAINAALNACPVTGGTIFFPPTINFYGISSSLIGKSKCNVQGVGPASQITYIHPATDNYPMFFCNGCSNFTIDKMHFIGSNAGQTLDLLWTNSESAINGQEGVFCLACTDVIITNTIAEQLGGAGFLDVRGTRNKLILDQGIKNTHYGFYVLSDDNGTPTDTQILFPTCSNNGSFGNSGVQGRGIGLTLAGTIQPVIGAIRTKIVEPICNGNSYYGIESYRGATGTEISGGTTNFNGFGGIHDYNNAFSNTHDVEQVGNGLPNVPNGSGGTIPGVTGYCTRVGGNYFTDVHDMKCHDNNSGGGNIGLIHINAENPFANSYGVSIKNNHVRNNLGTGNDIFVSNTSTNTFPGAVNAFYKVTAYDASRNVLAQSAEFSNTPVASSVNLSTWAPVANAASYVVCRGTSSGTESVGYITYANAFLDQNGAQLFTCSPPGSGTAITGVTLTNLSTAADTYNTVVANNILVGTTTASSLAYSAFNTIAWGNITTAATTTNLPVTASLIPTVDGQALGNSAVRWAADFTLAQFFRSAGAAGFPDIIGNGSAPLVIGDTNGAKLEHVANDTGLQLFNTATTCTTAATISTPCTTAAISLPVGYSDTNYRLGCSGLTRTNFPQIIDYAKSNTTFTITLNNTTAAAATYASFDCWAIHN